MLLIAFVLPTWRAYRRATALAGELSSYSLEQADQLLRLATLLNEHGFELQHTLDELGPKLETISVFLNQPLIGAALPWVLRRMFGRPYRRR